MRVSIFIGDLGERVSARVFPGWWSPKYFSSED
jgi:hypothetical protein